MKNAKVSTFFYFLFLFLSFFSRKIFLEHLGPEFLGLIGTLGNILGFLSLAELGVGTATAFNLYKPLQNADKAKINELVSVFGFLYRRIGTVILILGIVISAFFPLIFKNIELPIALAVLAFYAYLTSSLISYFINFRQIILSADQKGYVVTGYLQGANFVRVVIQMLLALYWGNYYAFIGIELVFSVIACIILNRRIDNEYPWLEISQKAGREALPRNEALVSNIKQVFVHKFAYFVLRQSDQIFIYAFVSLRMVAFYGNYTIIIDKLSQAVDSALGSFGAGVGNLIAEGEKDRIRKVFWEVLSLRFIVAGIIGFCCYHLIEPFISLWLGTDYILDRNILILLLITVFITMTRGAVDMFKEGYGLFADTWAAAAEAIINLTVTLLTAPKYGICGILLGKIVSTLLIVVLWKPYYLYKNGFKENVLHYWVEYLKYLVILVACWIGCHFLCCAVDFSLTSSQMINWLVTAIFTFATFSLVYFGALYIATRGTRDIAARFFSLITSKIR